MEQKTTVTTENKQQDGKFKANCIDNCIQPNWNDRSHSQQQRKLHTQE